MAGREALPSPGPEAPTRIATLDFVRGVAVLGILAVNIAGYAGPIAASETPALPMRAMAADEAVFALVLLVFEGKMRALFSMLFGASMLLFVERATARGRDGDLLQLNRLLWLLAFGWLHSTLLWWGDILFVYAVSGTIALALRRLPAPTLVVLAVVIYCTWHAWGFIDTLPYALAEEHVRLGTASTAEQALDLARRDGLAIRIAHDLAQAKLGFAALAADKLAHSPGWPLVMTLYTLGETVPLMLVGMALHASGLFAGRWPRAWLVGMAAAGIGIGGAPTAAYIGWAWARHFPPEGMSLLLAYGAAIPHALMGLGYAAALVLAAPWLAPSRIGQRFVAAGRMAVTNYLATSIVMCGLFYGWGLGLFGAVPPRWQALLVLGWWGVQLAASKPWLAHFRKGPAEWLWRSLTERRLVAMRHRPAAAPARLQEAANPS